jgi:hypothetical protein
MSPQATDNPVPREMLGTCFSTLTNGVLVLGLHGLAFLGDWIEQAGALTATLKQ